jgi:hypothetical protein
MIKKEYKGMVRDAVVAGACHEVVGINIQMEHADVRVVIYENESREKVINDKSYHISQREDSEGNTPFKDFFSQDALKVDGKAPFTNAEDWLLQKVAEYKDGQKVGEFTTSAKATTTKK